MVRKIINEEAFIEMARIGFIPIGTTNTTEVYVHSCKNHINLLKI